MEPMYIHINILIHGIRRNRATRTAKRSGETKRRSETKRRREAAKRRGGKHGMTPHHVSDGGLWKRGV